MTKIKLFAGDSNQETPKSKNIPFDEKKQK